MATYYVDPLGTDDGSHGTAVGAGAWKTLTYALGLGGVPLAGGHTLNVAAGTYPESSSGLVCTRAFASLVTVIGSAANPASVVVTNSTTNQILALLLAGATNLKFIGVSFVPNGDGSVGSTITARHNAATLNVSYEDCRFIGATNKADTHVYSINGTASINTSFTRCLLDGDNSTRQTAFQSAGSAGVIPTGITFTDCTVYSASIGMYVTDCDGLSVTGGTVFASGAQGISFARDGVAPVNNGRAVIDGVTIFSSGAATHAIMLGSGSVNSIAKNCRMFGPDNGGYGVVLKGIGDTVDRCFIAAGDANGVYFKGSKNVSVTNCTTLQQTSGGACFSSALGLVRTENPDGKSSGSIVRNCVALAAPGAVVFNWPAATHDNTDSVRLAGVVGTIGTNVPANGYGSPTLGVQPACPGRHGWSVA